MCPLLAIQVGQVVEDDQAAHAVADEVHLGGAAVGEDFFDCFLELGGDGDDVVFQRAVVEQPHPVTVPAQSAAQRPQGGAPHHVAVNQDDGVGRLPWPFAGSFPVAYQEALSTPVMVGQQQVVSRQQEEVDE